MIELQDFSIGYGSRRLLDDINVSFGCELTALIGRNGTGKSTLLKAIAGLNPRYSGRILVDGRDIRALSPRQMAREVAFVSTQRVRISNLRCADLVALGRAPYTNWIGRMQPLDRDIVFRALEAVGMRDFADRKIDTMSDGECQRVMIARALAQATPLIILDEPTSFLDLPNRYELCGLLRRLAHDEQKCILFSTHELDIALGLADNIALIDPPRLISQSPDQLRDSDMLQRLFSIPNPAF